MQRDLMLSAPCSLHTGHATLQEYLNAIQHFFHWIRSVTIEQPRHTLVYCKMWDVIQQRVCRLLLTHFSLHPIRVITLPC